MHAGSNLVSLPMVVEASYVAIIFLVFMSLFRLIVGTCKPHCDIIARLWSITTHIGVGAESALGGQDIFARKYMHEKLTNARIL